MGVVHPEQQQCEVERDRTSGPPRLSSSRLHQQRLSEQDQGGLSRAAFVKAAAGSAAAVLALSMVRAVLQETAGKTAVVVWYHSWAVWKTNAAVGCE